MHKEHTIFKNWIPEKLVVPLLIVALLPHVMILSVFTMNSTFTASFLDIDVDDVQFLFSLAYAMIVCGMFIHVRFFQYFNIRNYCLFMTILNITLLLALTMTKNPQLIFILRLLQGPACIFEGVILIPLIMSKIKTDHARIFAFSVLYSVMMTGDKFTTLIAKFAIENYTFNMMIYSIIIMHVIALTIYVFLFNHGRMFPKKPLYQLSLGGIFLMIGALISGAFTLVYGKRYYWFESPYIVSSFCACLILSGLFLFHQRTSKRPLFHYEVLKSERVIIGLMMFVCFYILRSSMSNIYQVMNIVWKWQWEYVLKIQFFNVAGSISGVIISYFLLKHKINFKYIFIGGFLLLSSSMLWFSYLFVPDIRVDAIIPALYLQGLSQGILFTPLVMFIVGSVHPSISNSASHAGVTIRFWSNTIGFSIMQNSVLHLTTKYQMYMTKNLEATSTIFQNEWNTIFGKYINTHLYNDAVQLTTMALKNKLYNQSLLITNMEIFRSLFIFGMLMILFIIVYKPLSQVLIRR